jgi:type I restriction enzyme, S subunit
VTLAEIAEHGHVLTPGRYVGAEAVEDDGVAFAEKMQTLTEKLGEQMAKGAELDQLIRQKLGGWGMSSDLNRGISPKYLDSGGIRVLNQKCVRDFAVDVAKARRHDDAQKSVAGRELEVGDILVNSTGVGTLGRVAQILALAETTIVDSHVTVVRAGERVTWNFLGVAMMRRQAEIEGLGEGSTGQTELSRGKLATLSFVVPPEPVLRVFDAATLPLRMRMSANAQQALTLAAARDTLLPRLISGQLRLPDFEALAA